MGVDLVARFYARLAAGTEMCVDVMSWYTRGSQVRRTYTLPATRQTSNSPYLIEDLEIDTYAVSG